MEIIEFWDENSLKEYEKVIYKSKGLHLKDFPVDNDESNDDGFINEWFYYYF